MDRLEEFREIIDNIKTSEREIKSEEPLLRNRISEKPKNTESLGAESQLFSFSKTFLSECSLINTTLIQLSEKLHKISQKSEQISFSITNSTSPKPDNSKEIEEALNICSMNISVMRNKLQEINLKEQEEDDKRRRKNESLGSLFTSLFKGPSTDHSNANHPILEHLRLILQFLEIRVGRGTEDLESYKTRRKNRELLMNQSTIRNNIKPSFSSPTYQNASVPNNPSAKNSSDDQLMSMLQVENTRMLEEMARGLFETLNTTESQVLEISRLQSTLQSHLTVQHDLTCRLFDDSITTFEDTKKGNEYLKKSAKEGSLMRKFLVALILSMSLLLLLLNYFNK